MKKSYSVLVFIFLFIESYAQFTLNLHGVEVKTGKKVLLTEIRKTITANGVFWYAYIENDKGTDNYDLNDLKKFNFTVSNLTEFWQNQAITYDVYKNLTKYGPQYELRKEWEDEALKYLNELEQRDLLFNDNFLENYLQ